MQATNYLINILVSRSGATPTSNTEPQGLSRLFNKLHRHLNRRKISNMNKIIHHHC